VTLTGDPPATMRAAVLHGRRDLRVEQRPVPRPGTGEVLLRVGAVGLCGTDAAEYAHGPRMMPITAAHPVTRHHGPMVIGHEFSGEVVDVGDGVAPDLRGRLVASCGAMSCGRCWQCRRGATNRCVRYAAVGLHRDGAAAGFVAVPVTSCLPADELGLGPDAAALAQPMSIAVHASRRGRVAAGERVLLLGAGGIGAFLTYTLARAGAELAVVDPDPERRGLALRLGARAALDAAGASEAAAEALGGPPHAVFEASGTGAGLESALATMPPGCRLVLVGLQERPTQLDLRRLTLTELELIGTNAMTWEPDFAAALRLVASRAEGWSDVAPTAWPLDELVSAGLDRLAAGNPPAVKVLVDPWAGRARPARTRPWPAVTGSQPWPGAEAAPEIAWPDR
jgi:(R,R)-butanediol dehydrogenase / meso-butanediol dehydrogenase / diacetyl reductase